MVFYIRDLSILDFVIHREFWNQSLVITWDDYTILWDKNREQVTGFGGNIGYP